MKGAPEKRNRKVLPQPPSELSLPAEGGAGCPAPPPALPLLPLKQGGDHHSPAHTGLGDHHPPAHPGLGDHHPPAHSVLGDHHPAAHLGLGITLKFTLTRFP